MRDRADSALIVLVGPPNSGKTTLYNWLTGSRFKTVNYPGSTVECLIGQTQGRYGEPLTVVDTPGVYSLQAQSPDEEVTVKTLFESDMATRLKGVVLCVDATQLERHLLLLQQLKASGLPLVIAVTMIDLLRGSGRELKLEELSRLSGAKVVAIEGLLGGGVKELVAAMGEMVARSDLKPATRPFFTPAEVENQVAQGKALAKEVTAQGRERLLPAERRSQWLDRWLLHPVLGFLSFFLVMAALFSTVFWLADPLMGLVDEGFTGLGELAHALLPQGLWADFVGDGLVSSFGSVLVFVPQIFILFFGLGLLEDSGYLARAATIVDRPLAALGLSGRSFVPLLSGYACAVPAIMAVRTIRSQRERWLATMVIPLLSCSARLPVYALLLSFVFWEKPAWQPGMALALIYLASVIVAGIAAALLNRLIKGLRDSEFLMELPIYRRPRLRVLLRGALLRTGSYVRRAGPVIFALALVLWVATSFPRPEGEVSSSQTVQASYAGQLGQMIEPVFTPMGVDWRVGVGLISAFAAREVFVSVLALVFDVSTADSEESIQASLLGKMAGAVTAEGERIFTLSSVVGLILFFMIALQCSSTVAIVARETNSWRLALTQLVVFNVVAYILAVGAVQTLRALGVS